MNIVFIRFNPDDYLTNKGQNSKPMENIQLKKEN